MKTITLLFALAMSLVACNVAPAQPIPSPCGLVCVGPDETLDAKQCKCVKSTSSPITPPCALVCLGPDETLDAQQCKCVKK
jgi:hypothetical protein